MTRRQSGTLSLNEAFNLITNGSLFYKGQRERMQLWFAGFNNYGRFGTNNKTTYAYPIQQGSDDTWVCHVGAEFNGLALKCDNTLWQWGDGSKGLGRYRFLTNYSSPALIPGTDWRVLAASRCNHAAIKCDDTLWTWGFNDGGMLGINVGHPACQAACSPVQVPGTNWKDIRGTSLGFVAIKHDGTMWGWGAQGSLPHGGASLVSCVSSPVQMPGTNWANFFGQDSASAGIGSLAAKKMDGTLWIQGKNNYGQLGIGNNDTSLANCMVLAGENWVDVSTSDHTFLGVKSDGTIWGSGRNHFGQLGVGDQIDRSSPVQVPGSNWMKVSTGYCAVGAIKNDGTLYVWGQRDRESFEDCFTSSPTARCAPTLVPGTGCGWIDIEMSRFGSHTFLRRKTI